MNGTYVLVLALSGESFIEVGGLGEIKFLRGFYAYSGSALNGLENRVGRHIRKEKKLRWHIDYLLAKAEILCVVYVESTLRMECKIAENLTKNLSHKDNFGCSDCKCKSHLFYSPDLAKLRELCVLAFSENGLNHVSINLRQN